MISDSYSPPFWQFNGHLQTIIPALSRKVVLPYPYIRERLNTPDGDFLDLDWLKKGNDSLVILCHGLEGSSTRPYILGMARHFFENGVDVLAWNYRGCSGELNNQLRMYHSGATDDLDLVVKHAHKKYQTIYLVGFSLGGNLSLKYLGEQGDQAVIKRAVTFSVPLDLYDGVQYLSKGFNIVYTKRFLKTLTSKIKLKHQQFPDQIDLSHINRIKNVFDFDDLYTSKIHGFDDAIDYYTQCSCIHFIDRIKIPTLIVNASNDTMIGKVALNPKTVSDHPFVQFLLTRQGGHCGFATSGASVYWSEQSALDFIQNK